MSTILDPEVPVKPSFWNGVTFFWIGVVGGVLGLAVFLGYLVATL